MPRMGECGTECGTGECGTDECGTGECGTGECRTDECGTGVKASQTVFSFPFLPLGMILVSVIVSPAMTPGLCLRPGTAESSLLQRFTQDFQPALGFLDAAAHRYPDSNPGLPQLRSQAGVGRPVLLSNLRKQI
ncbi:hypothetical protein SAMN05880570_3425 [Paenibacillus sp. RU4T]|nr:hypothetical protein SAMN05880555_3424 [Paenibacillus sp. RU4X]SIR42408.1 hypothetical protein SAMN05880570_3425 [Paenibacillus sp. RU4T]